MEQSNTKSREKIALYVTILAIGGTVILGVVGLTMAFRLTEETAKIQSLQYVFTALLPLWGTWMGTVMAFYFSKENFLAASQSVQRLVEQITPNQRLEATKCVKVMIPVDKIKPFVVKTPKPIVSNAQADDVSSNGGSNNANSPDRSTSPPSSPPTSPSPSLPDTSPGSTTTAENIGKPGTSASSNSISIIKVMDAIEFMNDNQISRLPLFIDKKLKYIIHLSTFEKFIAEITFSGTVNLKYGDATINDMVLYGSNSVKGFLQYGAQFLDQESNLKQAQALIEKNIYCQDIFITPTGNGNEEVLGWITNNIIAENSKDLKSN